MEPAVDALLTRLPRWRGGAPADDEVGGHRDGLIDVLALEQTEQDVRGPGALLMYRLPDGRQIGQRSQGVIVNADNQMSSGTRNPAR